MLAHCTSSLFWTRLASISEEEEKDAGIKHFVRHHRNPNASAPSLVITIRDTKLSRSQDFKTNITICMSTLRFDPRFKKDMDLVKKIIVSLRNGSGAIMATPSRLILNLLPRAWVLLLCAKLSFARCAR